MTRILDPSPGRTRVIGPTTTAKFAARMIAAQRVMSECLPDGFSAPIPLDVLLKLYVAEDEGNCLVVEDFSSSHNPKSSVVVRWIKALEAAELVEQRGNLIALTAHGYDTLTCMMAGIYAAQRTLD